MGFSGNLIYRIHPSRQDISSHPASTPEILGYCLSVCFCVCVRGDIHNWIHGFGDGDGGIDIDIGWQEAGRRGARWGGAGHMGHFQVVDDHISIPLLGEDAIAISQLSHPPLTMEMYILNSPSQVYLLK